jgi:hypothetical protein
MTKISSFKKWNITVLSVSLLLGVLFASWYIVKNPTVEIVNLPVKQLSIHTGKMSTPELSETPVNLNSTMKTPDIPTQQTNSVRTIVVEKDAKPDIKEVTKSVDFLEMLEKQSAAGNQSNFKNGTADTTSELSQEEQYQLIREGITYYDSLLESGSIDFFMQTSSAPDPGMGLGRASEGTWDGSFEFSGNRLRGTVSEDVIQYDGGNIHFSTTEEFAYDGETFERLVPAVPGYALIRSSDASYDSFYDPRWWGWNMQGQGTFSDVFDSLNVKNIQSVELNGNEVYHVTSIESNGGTFDLWINPEKNYRPERFMFSTPSTSSGGEWRMRVVKDFNFQEVAPDLWFPESAQATTTVIDTGGQETDILTHTIRFSNFKINQHIPSSRFNLDPLPRTTVYDRRSRESFKVPKEEN